MNKAAVQILFPLVIMAFLATAIFGFSVMSAPGHVMAGCFGSTPGGNCSMLSPIEHFEAHFHAFQSISTAVVQASSLFATFLLLVIAFLSLSITVNDLKRTYVLQRYDGFISPQRLQQWRWLALHEKRAPAFVYAVKR
jgi:hypothetical protein